MSVELQIFKQNRINQLNTIFNSNVARLNSTLANNIRIIQNSRARNKPALINSLRNQYNMDIIALRNNLNASIQKINSFTPEFSVNKTNVKDKKALLIGINYLNTDYELSGCIDDTNRMNSLLTNYGFNDIKILTDLTPVKPTKANILNEIKHFWMV